MSKAELLKWAGDHFGVEHMSLKRLESGSLLLLALAKQNLEVFLMVGKHLQKTKGEPFSNFKLLLKLLADQGSSFGAGLSLI